MSYGADDLHGTIIEEHIFHMAGATSPQLRHREHATKSVLQPEAEAASDKFKAVVYLATARSCSAVENSWRLSRVLALSRKR